MRDRLSAKDRSAPDPSGQTANPCKASRRQSKRGPGSILRPGAMSEWAITPSGPMDQRAMMAPSSLSSAAICGSGKGRSPGLTSSMPMLRELTSSRPCQEPAPACQARRSSGTSASVVPSSWTSQCALTSASGSQSRARAEGPSAMPV